MCYGFQHSLVLQRSVLNNSCCLTVLCLLLQWSSVNMTWNIKLTLNITKTPLTLHFVFSYSDGAKTKTHSLPEDFWGTEHPPCGHVSCRVVSTQTGVGHGVTWPGQWALEGAAQVVKGPGYDDVVVETDQRGHAQHPDADTCEQRQKKSSRGTDVRRQQDAVLSPVTTQVQIPPCLAAKMLLPPIGLKCVLQCYWCEF